MSGHVMMPFAAYATIPRSGIIQESSVTQTLLLLALLLALLLPDWEQAVAQLRPL